MTTSSINESDLVHFGDAAAGQYVISAQDQRPCVRQNPNALTRSSSFGLMTDATGALVVKPCSAAESHFYEKCATEHPDFADLLPTFLGKLTLSTPQQQQALTQQDPMSISAALQAQEATAEELVQKGQDALAAAQAHGKKLDTEQAVVLENVAAGFVKPNILDVKLGERLWDDDAPPAKRARLDKVAGETTSGTLGFRVAGMRVWKPVELNQGNSEGGEDHGMPASGQYKVFDKHYGRGLTSANVQGAFEAFFCDGSGSDRSQEQRRAVLELCEGVLESMEETLATEESRMYSSSILFVYEGDEEALHRAFDGAKEMQEREGEKEARDDGEDDESDDDALDKLPKIFAVKLIDFAHARWTPGQGPDQNMLRGIQSVRKVLQRIIVN